MTPSINAQSTYTEGRILLAIQALKTGQISGIRPAARAFNVPYATLRMRRAGIISRRDLKPNSMKLIVTKEAAIVRYILELDARGFSPPLNAVREMANKLLIKRGRDPVK